ncbi:MAG: C25 family cysteine peptidase [Agriterribacter sp.]
MQLNKNRNLLLVYPADMRFAGKCLSETYDLLNIHATCIEYSGRPPAIDFYKEFLQQDTDAVLVAGKKLYAPSTVLPGPFLCAHKKKVPAAWLPLQKETDVFPFIQTLKKVHRRKKALPGMALLAQWHPQYLRLTQRMTDLLEDKIPVFKWTGDIITREDVVHALGSGLGIGIYFGHGRPVGWVGYYGMRSHHFEGFTGNPLGCMLSLCCKTASRKRTGLSYAESLPLMGVSAAAFGAVRETRHTDNMKWAIRICTAINEGVDNLGDLLIHAEPPNIEAVEHYRIIGDPFAPLYSDAGGIKKAKAVAVSG